MLKSGLKTSEGKTSLGIITAGAFFIYYILSNRYNTPSIENILANAESAVDIAKAYADNSQSDMSNISGDAFDTSAIVALLFGMYKTFSKYSDDRVSLKKEEVKLKATLAANAQTNASVNGPTVNVQPEDIKKN